jgi:hypothetical protein
MNRRGTNYRGFIQRRGVAARMDDVRLTCDVCVRVRVQNRKKKNARKLYNRWSDEEKQALILGVEQYGVGA